MMKRITLPPDFRSVLSILGAFIVTTLGTFALYRLAFAHSFAANSSAAGLLRLLAIGVRADLALLAFELPVLLLLSGVRKPLAFRVTFFATAILGALHTLCAVANYFFFRERNLPLGEKLFAYLLTPADLLVYAGGFLASNRLVSLTLAAATVAAVWFCLRFPKRWNTAHPPATASPMTLSVTLALAALTFLPGLDAVTVKRSKVAWGFRVRLFNSRAYQNLPEHALNQAVGNPAYDLLRIYAPVYWGPSYRNRLTPTEACKTAVAELDLPGLIPDAKLPLLRNCPGNPLYSQLGIQNLVILQIEGLSQCLIERTSNGQPVMPNLQRLTREGLYFPNIVQGFSATAGGLFATVTGCPKAALEEQTHRYASYEVNAVYASLPHCLPDPQRYTFFGEGFRESYLEYAAFMAQQGFLVYGYPDICARLRQQNRLTENDDAQGIFDHAFLQTCAGLIRESRQPRFFAHLTTVTSHSPWTLPKDFQSPFTDPADRVFNYVDAAIADFIHTLDQDGKLDRTLIAVIADHTSLTFTDNLFEHLRVPLILYARALQPAKLNQTITTYGSQMDLTPTLLAFFPGDHPYAGFGISLLAPPPRQTTRPILSGSAHTMWLLADNHLLVYYPDQTPAQLFTIDHAIAGAENQAALQPQLTASLTHSLLAIYETGRNLAREQRIFPAKIHQAPPRQEAP